MLYALFMTAVAELVTYALILAISFLRLRFAELREHPRHSEQTVIYTGFTRLERAE
ncbi:hypothetical protein GCM10007170_40560 [Arthrobacter liuii]|uniref:Uncharacterized protein n=1 Tax=Arthrobacter liuii TaxID=1476996 RepID=A0ABQ2B0L6_9MICC|nr:hypothetical protein GCM10007170_40560 [Arthrobacter liuii]